MNPTATAARPISQDGSHWYYPTGEPCFELPKKDGSGMKKTTLADARKLNLLPSVTTILRVLDKPALTAWKIEQSCLALLTTPRLHAETDDQFVFRVLHTDRVQDEEMEQARDLGTRIHAALEALALGNLIDDDLQPWVLPAWEFVRSLGMVRAAEKIVVGNGYAGMVDLILEPGSDELLIVDYKSTKAKTLPKEAYLEHRLQLSAYAETQRDGHKLIRCGNLYVSTSEQGNFKWCEHVDVPNTFKYGFKPLLDHWQWSNNYRP